MVRRDPDATRQRILEAAAAEIHRHGFRNASIDQILSETGLTKGALYHHFPTKAALGYAVVDEVIRSWVISQWVEPMERANNPIDGLLQALRDLSPEDVQMACECGCPLNNLTQELSGSDEDFREHLNALCEAWRQGILDALIRGQEEGTVRRDLDPRAAATLIVSTVQGLAGSAKTTRDRELVLSAAGLFFDLLETFRP